MVLPRHGPREKEPPLTDGRFDALATCHLEGIRVRAGGGVDSTKPALEANDSQKNLVASRSKLGKVFRSEGPRHTPVPQCLNHPGLQHSDFQAKGGSRCIIQVRAEPFEVCPHERDPPVDFEREVSAFSWAMPPRYRNWAVCPNILPAASITSGGVRVV